MWVNTAAPGIFALLGAGWEGCDCRHIKSRRALRKINSEAAVENRDALCVSCDVHTLSSVWAEFFIVIADGILSRCWICNWASSQCDGIDLSSSIGASFVSLMILFGSALHQAHLISMKTLSVKKAHHDCFYCKCFRSFTRISLFEAKNLANLCIKISHAPSEFT